MKTLLLPACLLLGACVQSEHYGSYSQHGTLSYGAGHTITQYGGGAWQQSGYSAPQVNVNYHDGASHINIRTPPPAPQAPTIYHYPIYPQPTPTPPYIRSGQNLLPACTQQRTVRHSGQTIVIQGPCG